MKYLITLFLFIVSIDSFSQNDSIQYFKESEFLKFSSKKNAKYKIITINKGLITEKTSWNIKSNEIMRKLSYKTNDSSNFWRSIDYGDETKIIRTQKDSLLDVKKIDLKTDTLIGRVVYKTAYSIKDKYYSDYTKTNKNIFTLNKNIIPPVFYDDHFTFSHFLAEIVVLKEHSSVVFSGHDIIENKPYIIFIPFCIIIDKEGNLTQFVLLDSFDLEVDMKLFEAMLKSPKWASPAYKGDLPVDYSFYSYFEEIHYPPQLNKDFR